MNASDDSSTASNTSELSSVLRRWGHEVGFDLVGLAPVVPGLGMDRLEPWLDAGKQGEMTYMARNQEARQDPSRVLANAQSLMVVALTYPREDANDPAPGQGRISRYAWGSDYHDVMRRMLREVARRLRERWPEVQTRAAVDSAPVMERDYARLAGLGWIGKNTLLLSRSHGSWFFLGALLVDVKLDYDAPMETDHCGTCRSCLDACPTQAFDAPYQLDPRRCISYLTIEHRSAIPIDQREGLGSWVYGCDICQDVCPWNHKSARENLGAPTAGDFEPQPGRNPADLAQLVALTPEAFDHEFAGTAIHRIGRDRMVRNALIVAVNTGSLGLIRDALQRLLDDPAPLVRETAQWAWERLPPIGASPK